MKEVTLLKSNTFRMYLALFLVVWAVSLRLFITTGVLLLMIGWYAQKVFGDVE